MAQENKRWVIYPVTMTRQEFDQLTLDDFGNSLDGEDVELLSNSSSKALRDLVSPDPETRLRALKNNLQRMIDITD